MILQDPLQSQLSALVAGVCCRWQRVRGQAREAWPWLLPDPGPGRMDVLGNGRGLCLTFPGGP